MASLREGKAHRLAVRLPAVLFAALLSGGAVNAQEGAKGEIMEEAKRLEELDKMLRSENRFVRRSAVEKALNADKSVVREMAFHAALSSPDKSLQTRALRYFIERRDTIHVTVELPNESTADQESYYQNMTPAWWGIKIQENGQICGNFQDDRVKYCTYHGSFVPGGFNLGDKRNKLVLHVADGSTLRGHIESNDNVKLPAKLEIQ